MNRSIKYWAGQPALPRSSPAAGAISIVLIAGMFLVFVWKPSGWPSISTIPATNDDTLTPTYLSIDKLSEGGTDSLLAVAIGSSEGTRGNDGRKLKAYFGHVDPGNSVWNVGTFSYQHCPTCSPAVADGLQIARLKRQNKVIQAKAERVGLRLSTEQRLNALDLANQAPLAVLSSVGFVEHLARHMKAGESGFKAIVKARVDSYKNPQTKRWEAPGLGNSRSKITKDQDRRAWAIRQAIKSWQK